MADVRKVKQLGKKLKESGGEGNFIFIKANETIRIRVLPVGPDANFAMELTQFYLGPEIKGVISPHTFDMPCAIMDKYNELSESQDEDDRELASKMRPRSRYVCPVIKYKDPKGKEVDHQTGARLILLTKGVVQDMIDYFMDDEHGDFTDPKTGYDLKITRTGSGMTDTEYSVINSPVKPLDKKYDKVWDIAEMLQKAIPSYEQTETKLNQFLGIDDEDDEPTKETRKKKPTTKKKITRTKKIRRRG